MIIKEYVKICHECGNPIWMMYEDKKIEFWCGCCDEGRFFNTPEGVVIILEEFDD